MSNELPPLPHSRYGNKFRSLYTADQMHEYGLACERARDLIAELETHKSFADLWYFVMDEAPQEFERIVAEHQPKNWLQEAAKLRAARRGKT